MIGQRVLIKEDFLPINTWPLGRILGVYHGSDGKPKREESVTPTTSGYNLRPRSGKRVETRPTIERKTLQGGPVRSRKGRGRNDSPYIEEQTRSNNRNARRGGDQQHQEKKGACTRKSLSLAVLNVRVQYFVRGGTVGNRSRVSSKHLASLIFRSTGFDSSGVKKGLRCSCKMHVWVSGPPKISTAICSGYVTALALSYRTFPLRKV
ncbi:uncharacterized protein TNCV_5123891 [Trichonephila clavipes]|nr:uncharacterized protein TNCV_5123891 [Trichonephila clavipes]